MNLRACRGPEARPEASGDPRAHEGQAQGLAKAAKGREAELFGRAATVAADLAAVAEGLAPATRLPKAVYLRAGA